MTIALTALAQRRALSGQLPPPLLAVARHARGLS